MNPKSTDYVADALFTTSLLLGSGYFAVDGNFPMESILP